MPAKSDPEEKSKPSEHEDQEFIVQIGAIGGYRYNEHGAWVPCCFNLGDRVNEGSLRSNPDKPKSSLASRYASEGWIKPAP